jgi:hypothetical protein
MNWDAVAALAELTGRWRVTAGCKCSLYLEQFSMQLNSLNSNHAVSAIFPVLEDAPLIPS